MPSPAFPLLLLFTLMSAAAASCGCCQTINGVLTTCAGCPPSTTGLHLGFCGLTSLQPGAFISPVLARVTAVDLSNNALRHLPAGAFSGLSNLDLLDLSSNYISDIAPSALSSDDLPLLATLDLGYNALEEVPTALSLPNLTSLSLYWNPISNFSDASFLGVPRIQTLVADNCGLSSVSAGAFAPLGALTTLNLGNNALTKLPESGWHGPSKLTTLALQVNSIAALPPHFFDAFPLLESLPLYENQLTSLATGTFTRLSNLAGLYLNDNNISVLHQGCFDGLQGRFQYLALSNNQLTPQGCNANFAAIARIPGACFSNSTVR
jgi:Leucine-rich repeat (LRR) protein